MDGYKTRLFGEVVLMVFFFWGEGASGGHSLKGLGLKMTWVGWF